MAEWSQNLQHQQPWGLLEMQDPRPQPTPAVLEFAVQPNHIWSGAILQRVYSWALGTKAFPSSSFSLRTRGQLQETRWATGSLDLLSPGSTFPWQSLPPYNAVTLPPPRNGSCLDPCHLGESSIVNTLQPAVSTLEGFIFSSGSRNTPRISGEGITLHVLITALFCKKSRKCSLQRVQSEEFSGYCPPFSCKTSGKVIYWS